MVEMKISQKSIGLCTSEVSNSISTLLFMSGLPSLFSTVLMNPAEVPVADFPFLISNVTIDFSPAFNAKHGFLLNSSPLIALTYSGIRLGKTSVRI